VVVPVYNEQANNGETLRAAAAAIARSPFRADLVVVDDGSTDGSADAAASALSEFPVRVVRQANQGRFAARRAGLAEASGEYVLFLDSRVRLHPDGLGFVGDRVAHGETIWNGHVVIDTRRSPYGKFWNVLTELAWAAYFANPRTTSYTVADFDAFPKGTTCFLAPAALLRQAVGQVRSYYSDERNANDDTTMIRALAERQPIHISPHFACDYQPRTSLERFLRHAFQRGVVFLDGHGRRESRLFPAVVAFYPCSLLALALVLWQPVTAVGMALALSAASGAFAVAKRRDRSEALAFAALTPVYGLAHGAGMWRGLALLLAARLRPQPRRQSER
jgi:hypothetical protein